MRWNSDVSSITVALNIPSTVEIISPSIKFPPVKYDNMKTGVFTIVPSSEVTLGITDKTFAETVLDSFVIILSVKSSILYPGMRSIAS